MYVQNTLRNEWSATVVQEKESTFDYIQNALCILCLRLLDYYSKLLWQLQSWSFHMAFLDILSYRNLSDLNILVVEGVTGTTVSCCKQLGSSNCLQSKIQRIIMCIYIDELLCLKYFAAK